MLFHKLPQKDSILHLSDSSKKNLLAISKIKSILSSSFQNNLPFRISSILFLFLAFFIAGEGIAYFSQNTQTASQITNGQVENWGLGFQTPGTQPTGNASPKELKKYNAYFIGKDQKKIIYLTFDCGYENGNTPKILKALKKHHAPATFFVVGHFLESSPNLVKQMLKDGHTVGNHTYHHLDVSSISEQSAFQEELDSVRKKFHEVTGQKMVKYYRPPRGKYSFNNLIMAKKLGYRTFFWSLAYVDWNQDSQPSEETAMKTLTERIHPGAIVLLHNTSHTNAVILDRLLTKWEKMGYHFQPLSHIYCSKK